MTTDKNYYEIQGVGCVFCENIKDDEFIIITESSLIIEGKFSEIIEQISN